ncbi:MULTISPECIES: glycosyltransferase family 2 protein [Parabacteroides]|uniref:glycosyltransferase family 2 protein n=1 Tax=Parabacteroides leei TaxID=2939491 RepID=UPI0018987E37|nr:MULTISPECIES: glycosyltransferase family 2 protein [Parabacteroides]MCL3852089.1 glycosyltransferase [Parabacteroides leei]
MQKPLISVVVPVYNGEKYLSACLDSICNQTLQELEIIVVDDGSTDGSGRIADEYAAKDMRIQVIHQRNGHLSVARNAGLSVVKGDFVSFIDADDWIDKEMLKAMCATMVSNSLDLVITGVRVEYPGENRFYYQRTDIYLEANTRKDIKTLYFRLKELCLFNYVWNKLYRVSFLQANNLSFIVEPPYEDESFNMEVFMKASSIGVLSDTPYHYMRYDNGSIVASYKADLLNAYADKCKIYHRFFTHLQMSPEWIKESLQEGWWDTYCGYVQSLYKKNARLSRKKRMELIERHIYQDRSFQDLVSVIRPHDRMEKVFRTLSQYGSPRQIDLMYSTLFYLRYHLEGLYRYYRKTKQTR